MVLPLNEKPNKRKRVQITFKLPSLTKQEYKHESDINEIINKYYKTGELPIKSGAIYADLSKITDYQDLRLRITEFEDYFDSLPSAIRSRFSNDPAMLVEWSSDPKNYQEAVRMGLKVAKVAGQGTTEPKPTSTENVEKLTKPSEK